MGDTGESKRDDIGDSFRPAAYGGPRESGDSYQGQMGDPDRVNAEGSAYDKSTSVKVEQESPRPTHSRNSGHNYPARGEPVPPVGGGVGGGHPTPPYDEPVDYDLHFDDQILKAMAPPTDPVALRYQELIANSAPRTELEVALKAELDRRTHHVERLTNEVTKLKQFISKRKQTYKRKRKEEGAPRKSLSAYNLFVRERFAKLAKENDKALKSSDTGAQLKRVPPASLVAATGNEWRALSAEEKKKYEEMARPDRERYEEQMANYQPPEKQNRKRNKTGYNIFFSAHVLRLKQSDSGVPSERGSVARLVGDAWKKMNADEKDYYEREADKQNELHPMDKPPPGPLHDSRAMMPDPNMGAPPPQGMYGGSGPPPMGGMPPGPPPPDYGHPMDGRSGVGPPPPDYGPPPVIHQPSGYDSRGGYYGGGQYPPSYGGYDYYNQPYPPPPPPGPPPPAGRGGPPPPPGPSYPPPYGYPPDDRGQSAYM